MLRKLLGIVGVSSLLIASPLSTASAADMPLKAPLPPVAPSWTGCYIDGGAGYGTWTGDHYYESPALVPITATYTAGGRGWLGRVGGGCDYQFSLGNLGSWVIGAFADYDFRHIHGDFNSFAGFLVGDSDQRSAWAAGGRLGYLVTPSLLTYVDGGYTQTRFGSTTFGFAVAPFTPGFASMNAATYNGWFVGGGTEYALNFSWLPVRGLFWRNEYRFATYNSADVPITFAGVVAADEHIHPYDQTITSSLVWRFNWMP